MSVLFVPCLCSIWLNEKNEVSDSKTFPVLLSEFLSNLDEISSEKMISEIAINHSQGSKWLLTSCFPEGFVLAHTLQSLYSKFPLHDRSLFGLRRAVQSQWGLFEPEKMHYLNINDSIQYIHWASVNSDWLGLNSWNAFYCIHQFSL